MSVSVGWRAPGVNWTDNCAEMFWKIRTRNQTLTVTMKIVTTTYAAGETKKE